MELNEIWTEKYRPKMLEDIVGQKHVVDRLKAFVKNCSLPHCLFTGSAGCGKTTAALAIAHELFGNQWKSNFLELNASDERGIDTIRIKVKDFARTMALGGSFKIIYLDEADSLTKDAQHALRRTMEKYTDTARFILSCNYSSKIILPIQSRTAVFRFMPLSENEIIGFLKHIAANEKLSVNEDAYKSIVYIAEGDMRKAINILQTASVLGGKINEDVIYSVTSRADPNAVNKMLTTAINGGFEAARNQLLALLYERGLAGEDLIKEIHNQIFNLNIPEIKKVGLLEKVGEYEFRLTEGSNARIQLEALLAQIALMGR
ncbi:MAG: replication factor C small subunit [Candidatus Aenigmarchaeota archaeon]|nr:replication factor C small subunit [Candidatus Aenigmarchaeota archaeon]